MNEKILSLAIEAAKEAGERALGIRSTGLQVQYKGVRDLVTRADTEAERIIIDKIRGVFPTHTILAEESFAAMDGIHSHGDPLWVVDPIDGTTNFARGHHQFAISIAYAERGRIVAGVVFAPALNELFYATNGEGAYLNGERITVSKVDELQKALVATGLPYIREDVELLMKRARVVVEHCADLRRIGACSLDMCWVAAGRLDAYYESVMPWDMAAGSVIVQEAGGIVGYLSPAPEALSLPLFLRSDDLLVANPSIFDELQRRLS